MKKSKGVYKKWELMVMTLVIVSGIVLDYANVIIVINISGQPLAKTNILKENMHKALHAFNYVELKENK